MAITLRAGVTYRQFSDLVKSVYVEVASRDFGTARRPATTSRVAMLTGLTRREAARQRELLEQAQPPGPDRVHSTARVLTGWYTDADFLDANGRPAALDATADNGFPALYQRYSGGDIPQSTMLKELLAVGAVTRTQDGRLVPLTRFFRPVATDTHAIERAGHVLSDLGQAIRHNIYRQENEPTRFEGRAWSAVIPRQRADAFRAFLEERGQAFLEEIDAWLVAHEDPGGDPATHVRLGAGAYEIRTVAADVPRRAAVDGTEPRRGEADDGDGDDDDQT